MRYVRNNIAEQNDFLGCTGAGKGFFFFLDSTVFAYAYEIYRRNWQYFDRNPNDPRCTYVRL